MNLRWLIIPTLLCLSSCAAFSGPVLQPEISRLVAADRINVAAARIEADNADYGQGNYLLYYLDRGLVEYYAGLYPQSIQSFDKAKKRFEELYTQSLTREAASWAVNDYALPYHGADYEYVLVNIFQALNYLSSGKVSEALVEARDLDAKYQVVDKLALAAKRRRFEDNGFARMFMGFVAEASGRADDRDSARIFYQQAREVYAQYYEGQYEPEILADRLRALDGGRQEGDHAVVYVIQLAGFAPVKLAQRIPVPVERDLVAQAALPVFARRDFEIRRGRVTAEDAGGSAVRASTELGVSIEDLAVKDLESRKAVTLSKALLRPALKYVVERQQREIIHKRFGSPAAGAFGLVSSLYNIYSEQADLRSWQALPAEIRVARLSLIPGKYHLRFEHLSESMVVVEPVDLGEMDLVPGRAYFVVCRGRR